MVNQKVLVADAISPRGVEALRLEGRLDVDVQTGLKEAQLIQVIPSYAAIVVRSQTKVTAPVINAAKSLKAIGRAGVGVDNVDVDAATRRGIIVMNTPAGNTISTAEHAFSLLVSIARSIPQADASVKAGRWDRKSFEGVELNGKTLGILGMGRIGSEIARRAIAFGMRPIAYDPYLSPTRARSLQVELLEVRQSGQVPRTHAWAGSSQMSQARSAAGPAVTKPLSSRASSAPTSPSSTPTGSAAPAC